MSSSASGPTLRHLTACLAAALIATVPVYAWAADIVHVVEKGQTLGRIAKRYRTTAAAIREANGLRAGQQIHPGLSLVIPEKGKEGKAAKGAADKGLDRGKGDKADARGKKGALKAKADDGGGAGDKGEVVWKGKPKAGHVRMMRGSDHIEVQLVNRKGRPSPAGLAGLSKLLRFYPTGAVTPIDPRLATLISTVSDHFGGKPIKVVSGFRPYSPAQYTPHSNHNVGRAMDFAIEGVPNTAIRDFCRTFPNAGVGYYPNSSFVHLDVRTEKTYWIDHSKAGEAPRYESAGGHGRADETAAEVEPHVGAAERAGGSGEGERGSEETP